MSWQEYVDNNLMCAVDAEGNTLSSAALVGQNPASVWAKSAAFPDFTEEQIQAVLNIFDGTNPGSFTIGGVKFMVLFSDDPQRRLRGKCQGGGCSISKTEQALVVGIWAEPVTAGACNKIVETLAEYLMSMSY